MKTRQQIADETRDKIARPANYVYDRRLPEWEPAETTLSRDQFIRQVEPMHDRIVVQLLKQPQGAIVLTDQPPLIGGCRKAKVLKTGPGKWVPGEWWKLNSRPTLKFNRRASHLYTSDSKTWAWFHGYRRPISVQPGQIVLIGNWVDLEIEDIALCQEADIRVVLN